MVLARVRRMPAAASAAVLAVAVAVGATASVAHAAPGHPGTPAPTKPSQPAKPLAAAAAAARAKKLGEPVEVTSATTPIARTVANPDGTYTVGLNAQPVRVKKGNGWVDLDPRLRRNADGSYSPAATPTQLTISGGRSTQLATMANRGRALTLSWPKALPPATVVDATATYPNVLSGVDLQVTVSDQGGFSHVLVIRDPAAANNPELKTLRLTATTSNGLQLSAHDAGDLQAVDTFGRTLFTAPAPLMWDSSTDDPTNLSPNGTQTPAPSTPAGPGNGAKIATVGVDLTGNNLTLTPDNALLTNPQTRYPVYVDPSWNPNWANASQNSWTYISSYFHNQPYLNSRFNDGVARAGYNGWEQPYGAARSYFQFGIPSAIWGAHVHRATLQITELWSSADNTATIDLYHTCRIDAATTWDRKPCQGPRVASRDVGPAHKDQQQPLTPTA